MIIDSHYHYEERIQPLDGLVELMDRHGIDRIALIPTMMEPFVYGRLLQRTGGWMRRALLGRFRRMGLALYRSTARKDGKAILLHRRYDTYPNPPNDDVARALAAHPDRFYGWIFVNPRGDDPIAELERWAGQPGWIGAKAHPFWHRYPVGQLDDVAAWCAERDWPLLIHLGGDRESGDFRVLPERHPSLKVVYAHAAVPFYREAWEFAGDRAGVFVDLSSPYLDGALRREAVEALGAAKCCYGTDGPYGYPDSDGRYDHGHIVRQIRGWGLEAADEERLLSGTFRELAGV